MGTGICIVWMLCMRSSRSIVPLAGQWPSPAPHGQIFSCMCWLGCEGKKTREVWINMLFMPFVQLQFIIYTRITKSSLVFTLRCGAVRCVSDPCWSTPPNEQHEIVFKLKKYKNKLKTATTTKKLREIVHPLKIDFVWCALHCAVCSFAHECVQCRLSVPRGKCTKQLAAPNYE